jgi:hypothetical protein
MKYHITYICISSHHQHPSDVYTPSPLLDLDRESPSARALVLPVLPTQESKRLTSSYHPKAEIILEPRPSTLDPHLHRSGIPGERTLSVAFVPGPVTFFTVMVIAICEVAAREVRVQDFFRGVPYCTVRSFASSWVFGVARVGRRQVQVD